MMHSANGGKVEERGLEKKKQRGNPLQKSDQLICNTMV